MADLVNARGATCWMLFASSVRESLSWYFPTMQPRSLPAEPPVAKAPPDLSTQGSRGLPLSVVYADALYRPVPPVEYDDEGYPGPDSRVSESTRHAEASNYCYDALRVWFRDRQGTLVANDLLVLFEEGNPAAALSPDVMVIFDVGNPNRSSFKVWEEGHAVPAFALEVLSERTWRKDIRVKPGLYAALGVREFWQFEPFESRLAGHRLDQDGYRRIQPLEDGGLRSEVLDLEVVVEDGRLRFRNPGGREILPDHVQSEALRAESDRRCDQEAAARREAEERRDQEAAARREAEQRAVRAERRAAEMEALLKRSRALA